MKIATVFSGIGAPEYALKTYFKRLNPKIVFACDCGETKPLDNSVVLKLKSIKDPSLRQKAVKKAYLKNRKVNWIKETYFNNYRSLGISENKWHDDIRFIDGKSYFGKVGLFIGGSPCQSFSNMGHRGGLEDARGTLFYDYARLINEIKPDVFIYENVPGMLTHDKGKTWITIQKIFDSLGYDIKSSILNATDYGIPQNRKRLFVVGFKDRNKGELFSFPKKKKLRKLVPAFLEKNVDAKYYLGEKGFEFTTTHNGRAKIGMKIIRTEKRNQQFNWNGDFVFVPLEFIQNNKAIMARAYVGDYKGYRGAIRKLTPLECHRLMGFKKDFRYCSNDTEAYMQAGNSIVVNVMQSLIQAILDTGVAIQ
jgi:DNA (cytosine-5)-methyltransferase 1